MEAGIIEKNVATWACPMLLVKKKDDGTGKQKFRIALDLRLLNTIIMHSSFPLPKIQNIISNLANYKFFTILDMPSAYFQLDLPPVYRDKLSFTTQWGTYMFLRTPPGLKTAASRFQGMADAIKEDN